MYFKMPNEWVVDVAEATDFGDMVKALDVAINIASRSLDILMKFRDGGEDFRYPVNTK